MKIELNHSLRKLNTFGIDVCCRQLITLDMPQEVAQLRQEGVFNAPFYLMGGGSNTLFSGNFDGSVIQLQNRGIEVVHETADKIILKAAAGEAWQSVVEYCLKNDLYGAENLIDIPGWTGSAPVQNIGAYGAEAKDIVFQVNGVMLHEAAFVQFRNAECQFSYRNSIFKKHYRNRLLITEVLFQLSKKPKFNLEYEALKNYLTSNNQEITLQNVAKAIQGIRASKLPDLQMLGSAGSFFKNPLVSQAQFELLAARFPNLPHYPAEADLIKLSAGFLIEQCGLKGYREGSVGIYPKQALVIVNWGGATGKEIITFYRKIQAAVKDKFGVLIEPEVNEI
ncbi:MAG: UDP-N-acetylmuramate dehydrogenase [Bacteroidales bacterium]|jgi:UDP-N-acetylmuramate dehydrogenase|nr:UDP-N-acetylmuramate dehydrogenase [Bacteroidales bacterium]